MLAHPKLRILWNIPCLIPWPIFVEGFPPFEDGRAGETLGEVKQLLIYRPEKDGHEKGNDPAEH